MSRCVSAQCHMNVTCHMKVVSLTTFDIAGLSCRVLNEWREQREEAAAAEALLSRDRDSRVVSATSSQLRRSAGGVVHALRCLLGARCDRRSAFLSPHRIGVHSTRHGSTMPNSFTMANCMTAERVR